MKPPSMRFDSIKYSSLHVPHDMAIFLYKGVPALKAREAHRRIQSNNLGEPLMERMPLVVALYEYLQGVIVSGKSERTFNAYYRTLTYFFAYLDENDLIVSLGNVEGLYVGWGLHISGKYERSEIKWETASFLINKVGTCIGNVVGILPKALSAKCRLKPRRGRGSPSGAEFLSSVDEFCRDLMDLVACLSVGSINSDLPLALTCAESDFVYYTYAGLGRKSGVQVKKGQEMGSLPNISPDDKSIRALINLRLVCEAFLFMRNTAANIEQVKNIKFAKRRSTYSKNGVKFVAYKERSSGDVSYSVASEHIGWFEEYLSFRQYVVGMYPSDLLFPFLRAGLCNQREVLSDGGLRRVVKALSRKFIPPRTLKKHQINKVLQVTEDPGAASTLGQHDQRTFFKSYFYPNHNISSKEWSNFWRELDNRMRALAPGDCAENKPIKYQLKLGGFPEPDCINPAGCLFCEQYRGVGSLDYIWSLLSYKKLKLIEYAASKAALLTDEITPLEGVIARISEIEEHFLLDVPNGTSLHLEAISRVSEEYYHTDWNGFIELIDAYEL